MPVDHLNGRSRVNRASVIYRGQRTIFIPSSEPVRLERSEPYSVDCSHTLFMPGKDRPLLFPTHL